MVAPLQIALCRLHCFGDPSPIGNAPPIEVSNTYEDRMVRAGVSLTLLREQGFTDHDELFHVLQALHFQGSKAVDAIDNVITEFGEGNHGIGARVVKRADALLTWLRSDPTLHRIHIEDLMTRAGPPLAAWRELVLKHKPRFGNPNHDCGVTERNLRPRSRSKSPQPNDRG